MPRLLIVDLRFDRSTICSKVYHTMASKRLQSPVLKSKKQKKSDNLTVSVRNEYFSDAFKAKFLQLYSQDSVNKFEENGAEIIKKPFTCCVLPKFIEDEKFLTVLTDELTDLQLNEKSNDLYKFSQSDDLKNVSTSAITALKKLLYGEFRCWLQDMTGIPLNDTVDMNFSKYEFTDVLLCHDDELEGRRIAYILYLVSPSWCQEDGGTLDLFDTDENLQPSEVVKSLIPRNNNLVFFEVTPTSFHQVSEILTEDRNRLSVSGWFHGANIERPPPFLEPQPDLESPGFVEEEIFRAWINPLYLEKDVQIQIQDTFQADSEIELTAFLQEQKYEELAKALNQCDITWKMVGPANKRHFDQTAKSACPEVVSQFFQVLGSEAMFLVLSNLTGLHLHRLAGNDSDSDDDEKKQKRVPSEPRWRSSIRRWSAGCYTLIHDDDKTISETALDATLFFSCQDWKPEYGGYTSYIAKDEDEELLSVCPKSNALALVYRDPETLSFVKHINSKMKERRTEDRCFQDIFCVYYE